MTIFRILFIIAQFAILVNFCQKQYSPAFMTEIEPRKYKVLNDEKVINKQFQQATVSWYGDKFHGKKTKYGEVYDQWGNTCACNCYPYNTWIMFEYCGRTAFGRVNDTGNFERYGRQFDLSRGIAEQLEIANKGVVKLHYKVLDR